MKCRCEVAECLAGTSHGGTSRRSCSEISHSALHFCAAISFQLLVGQMSVAEPCRQAGSSADHLAQPLLKAALTSKLGLTAWGSVSSVLSIRSDGNPQPLWVLQTCKTGALKMSVLLG